MLTQAPCCQDSQLIEVGRTYQTSFYDSFTVISVYWIDNSWCITGVDEINGDADLLHPEDFISLIC
jgi:hypothetical protein